MKSLWILQHWLINKRNLTILNLKLSYLQTVLCKRKVLHASVNKLMNCGNSPPSLYPNVADKLNCILTSSEMESWLKNPVRIKPSVKHTKLWEKPRVLLSTLDKEETWIHKNSNLNIQLAFWSEPSKFSIFRKILSTSNSKQLQTGAITAKSESKYHGLWHFPLKIDKTELIGINFKWSFLISKA